MLKISLLPLARKGFLLSGALLSLATCCLAQAPAKPAPRPPSTAGKLPATATPPAALGSAPAIEDRAKALTTNMAQALGLTPAQVEKVRAVNLNSVRKVEAARQRFRQEPGQLRDYIEEIGLARLEQLKDVLTPAQFTRYQRKREEKMGIPTTQGAQGNPPPGLGRPDSE